MRKKIGFFLLLLNLVWTSPSIAGSDPLVLLETNKGNIVIRCYKEQAPKTVENFLAYVEDGFYDGTIFHRVIDTFIIQGGGFDKDMIPKPTRAPIINESINQLKNKKYTVSMALTTDPYSAASQFFINLKDNEHLDYDASKNKLGYTVFGEILEGKDTVEKIRKTKTITFSYYSETFKKKLAFDDTPEKPIIIQKATILRP